MGVLVTVEGGYWAAIRDTPGDVLAAVEALVERPAWQRRAACRGQGTAAWFPAGRGVKPPEEALAACGRCPVAAECAEAGRGEAAGIWGGRRVRRGREAA